MPIEEWDELPAWQGQMYIDGLTDMGILGEKGTGKHNATGGSQPGATPGIPVDYAAGAPLPRGFKTRRAG